jgi:hypothetical protein
MRRVLAVAAGLAVVALVATRAEATPIGTLTTTDKLTFTLSDNGLFGDIYTADGTSDTRQFTLSLNTTNYTGDPTDTFNSLALKLASQIDAAQQTSSPAGFNFQLGGLNDGGCDGSGAGYFCTDSSAGVLLNGSTYMWTFLVDPKGSFFTDPGDMSIKAQWFTADGLLRKRCPLERFKQVPGIVRTREVRVERQGLLQGLAGAVGLAGARIGKPQVILEDGVGRLLG